MVADVILAMTMYPWVAHQRHLRLQYVMAVVPVHYYGWIGHIHDERVMSPTDDLGLLFLRSKFWNF